MSSTPGMVREAWGAARGRAIPFEESGPQLCAHADFKVGGWFDLVSESLRPAASSSCEA